VPEYADEVVILERVYHIVFVFFFRRARAFLLAKGKRKPSAEANVGERCGVLLILMWL
jgi:hypothetical protein